MRTENSNIMIQRALSSVLHAVPRVPRGYLSWAATGIFSMLVLLSPARFAQAQDAFVQTGVASYYAEEFHGKKTANGERYSMWGMTAAHQTLPFNTLVRVTHLGNGKRVVVRINDAGPFKDERILDLTKTAAAKLGMVKSGKALVRIEAIGEAPSPTGDHISKNEFYKLDISRATLRGFGIQVASFADLDALIRRLNELERMDVGHLYVQMADTPGKRLHRLVIGSFETRAAAADWLGKIKKRGVTGFVFQVR